MADIRVKQIRSTIGRPKKQRRIMEALGLRRIGQDNTLPDNPMVRGMIFKVQHLVELS